ncbi:MAG TPA: hypothetical protein VFJ59_14845 [Pseudolabrys sp.]|nr:hypothetical protein [Pseudolabrys sp.]
MFKSVQNAYLVRPITSGLSPRSSAGQGHIGFLVDGLNRPEGMAWRTAFFGIKKPRQKAGGGEEGRKRLHACSLDEKGKVVCDAAHICLANEPVFSCRHSVKENVKDMLRGNNVSDSVFAFVIENSKLIMVFLLIGTIIGLASFGSRPYQHETRE